jgi:hypothetical protein
MDDDPNWGGSFTSEGFNIMGTQRLVSAGLVLVWLAGCQGTVESPPEAGDSLSTNENELLSLNRKEVAHSGTRLSAQFFEVGDVSSFAQFKDNTLNLPCRFLRDVAGTFRCLPTERGDLRFRDSGCTVPMAVTSSSNGEAPPAPEPYFIAEMPAVACDALGTSRWKAYQVGSALSVTTSFRSDGEGGCFESPLYPGELPFAATEALPTSFVDAQIGYRAAGVRLAEKILFGTDGSRSPLSADGSASNRRYVDLWLNAEVEAHRTIIRAAGEDYDSVWAGPQAREIAFSDSACSSQSVAGVDSCGVRPEMVGISSIAVNSACNRELQYKRVTPTIASPAYETNPFFPGSCIQVQPEWEPGTSFHSLGQSANSQRYLTGSTQLKGSGRLAWVELQNQDLSQTRMGLYDRELGAECSVSTDAQGNTTCFPSRLSSFSLVYLDAACTTRGIVGDGNTVIPGDPEVASCNTKPVYVVRPANLGDWSKFVKAVRGPAIGTTPSPLYMSVFGHCFPIGSGNAYSVSSVTELAPVSLSLVTR